MQWAFTSGIIYVSVETMGAQYDIKLRYKSTLDKIIYYNWYVYQLNLIFYKILFVHLLITNAAPSL